MTTDNALATGLFSLSNPQLILDPYPTYTALRRNDPVHQSSMYGGSWVIFSYDDITALLREPRLTNNRATLPIKALPAEQQQEFADIVPVLTRWVAFFDGHDHHVRRQHMNAVCDLYSRDVLVPVIQNAIDTLLDRWTGRHDLVQDFARPLPAMVITKLLGASDNDHVQLAEWSDDIAYLFGASNLTVEDLRRGQRAIHDFAEYLLEHTVNAMRAHHPTMITRLAEEDTDGFRFVLNEACAQGMLLMFAGLEPMRYLLGNAVWSLESHPEQRHLITENDRTLHRAVEEFLRYDGPVQYIGRMAAEDFTYKGHRIEAGQPVLLYVGAANRDEHHFRDPDTLDLTRHPNPHLSFGRGAHNCIGGTLVRTQTAMALRALATRFPALHVVREVSPVYNTNLGFRGFSSLTVHTGL
ncbi:cytochrome P450 [Lentzea sp. NBRC 102530]|uniref:cytochrome P450 n=1 Tax=Lentzea sp. NBRC 102530 TaxID=3032201 RepID=UPI0024A2F261|nr:cytochrome P450 [Lentzea sp. NBRC 102530]GLY55154.1 cytochrome P-450 like protein [Lentzea sp. NBRC 102530]